MSDKFRRTAPLIISFADGEQPTAQKLTAVATQSRNGLALLESVIGDPWNQGGDTWLSDNSLQLANLARAIGEMKYLNPAIYPSEEDFYFTEKLGDRYAGEGAGHLLFAPTEGTSTGGGIPATYTIVTDTNSLFVTPVTNEYDVDATGKFWVDQSTGRFRVYGALAAADKITYQVSPSTADWVTNQETMPNIVPDARQALYTGVRVSSASGKYFIHLPPRMPLTLSDREFTERYPNANERADTLNLATTVTPYKMWTQASSALTGAGSEHYRYRLPKEILDLYSGKANGTEYPQGFMYLYDQATKTIVENVRFYKSSLGDLDYVIEVEADASDIDFSTYVSAVETEAAYSATGLSLIVLASPVARSVWTLANAFYQHKHDNKGALDSNVSHNSLGHLNPPTSDYTAHSARFPSNIPPWTGSRWEFDPHVSLLSRVGSYGGAHANRRDPNDNAMLGNLILANSVAVSGVFLDAACTNSSFKIAFGANDGDYIRGSTVGIQAIATQTNHHGLYTTGNGTGHGVLAAGGLGAGACGVYGFANINSGAGVWGETDTNNGLGVYGKVVDGGYGVKGEATTADGTGVYGVGFGTGHGGYFTGGGGIDGHGVLASSAQGDGVNATTSSSGRYAVRGDTTTGGGGYFKTTAAGKSALDAVNTSTGSALYAYNSSSGNAVWGASVSGYGGKFTGHVSGGASGLAALTLTPQAADPTTAAQGDIFISSVTGHPNTHTGVSWARPVSCIYAATSDYTTPLVTKTNTVTSQQEVVSLYTFPADSWRDGQTVRVVFNGRLDAMTDGGNCTIRIRFGTTVIYQSAALTSTGNWIGEINFVIGSVGATADKNGTEYVQEPGSSSLVPNPLSSTTFDTTSIQDLDVTVQFSVTGGNNVFELYNIAAYVSG